MLTCSIKFGARPTIGVQAGNLDCSTVMTFLPAAPSYRSTSGVRAAITTSPVALLQSSADAKAGADSATSAAPTQMSSPRFMLPAPPQLPMAAESPPPRHADFRPPRDASNPRWNPAVPPEAWPPAPQTRTQLRPSSQPKVRPNV